MGKKILGILGVALLVVWAGIAQADVIKTFGVIGQFATPTTRTMDGTFTVDETTGAVTKLDIDVTGFVGFYDNISVTPASDGVMLIAQNGVGGVNQIQLHILTPNPGTFMGFAGGPIVGGTIIVFSTGQVLASGASGSVVPEPATIALLGIGLVGIGFAQRRKSL